MKQNSFFPKYRREHGGHLTLNKRKSKRPLNIKKPVHLVLRSDLAKGKRSLFRNRKLVQRVLSRYAVMFNVKIYEKAICGNHLHCLVKGFSKKQLQNFFRVFAGQVAQEILRLYPLQKNEQKAHRGGTHPKSQKSFWSVLVFTRIVSWGRDFGNVRRYVIRNTLEVLGLIEYKRGKNRIHVAKSKPLFSKQKNNKIISYETHRNRIQVAKNLVRQKSLRS